MTATRVSAQVAPTAAAVKSVPPLRDAAPRRTPGFVSKAPLPFRLGGANAKRPSDGPGAPLAAPIRARLEASLGVDFGAVRVHTDASAARAAGAQQARAFTVGSDIFLGAGERADDLELLGHEAAHVVQQQGGATVVQGFSAGQEGFFEGEAGRASAAVGRGESFSVQGRTGAVGPQREGALDFVESAAWSLLNEVAPELAPILKKGPAGVIDWIKEKVSAAFEAMFNVLMAPVRTITGIGKWLHTKFAPLLAWMQDAAAKIARNDCSPLREAAEKIEQVAASIITPIVEKLQFVAGKIGDVFKAIWGKIGAPVWEWIKQYAGQQWDAVQKLVSWIWDKAAPVRKLAARAWTWLKNKIGIGEGPEGQNGILQWVQRKAEAAWDWFKAKIEPYKKQLITIAAVVAGVLVLISPAGPVLIIGGIVVGLIQGVRWIKANWGKGNLIVQARTYLEKNLIPSLLGSLKKMTAAVTKMAGSINGKLGELSASAGNLVGAVAESVLRFAVAAMQWVADQVIDLAQWGSDKLQGLAKWIEDALGRLHKFLQPFIEFLGKVGSLVLDIYGLPLLLAGKLWEMIPKCIRDPFVDWIGPLLLGQIEIFKELVKDTAAWQKTKADVMNIIRLVFVKKDLVGAIKATFYLVLRVFNLPLELLEEVKDKAVKAWNDVTKAPIAFIKNCVRVIGRGLQRYGSKLKDHLSYGIEGWLLGEVKEKGVRKPTSWTDTKQVFGFVLDVLGLSMDHVFTLLKKRFDKDKVDRLRKWWGRLTRAWDWVQENLSKSPGEVTAGLIDQAKGFGKSIIEGVVIWIAQQVAAELAAEATAAAASAGLSEVISAVRRIWMGIKAAVRWLRTIVDMINRALDAIGNIVAGIIEPGAVVLENAMHIATPAVIGLLAGMVGLGGVGAYIRQLIDDLREMVDTAILWLIDKAKGAIEAALKLVGAGVAALKEWWKKTRKVGKGNDQHTLSFEGGEDDAELFLQSTKRPAKDAIKAAKTDPKYQNPVALKALDDAEKLIPAIRADRTKLRAARKAGKTAEVDTLTDAISTNFDKIADFLGIVYQGGGTLGDKDNPIPIQWLKAKIADYPAIQLAPSDAVRAAKVAKNLSASEDLPLADVAKLSGAFKQKPLGGARQLDGLTIGVTHPVASKIKPDFVFQASEKVTGNTNKDAFNREVQRWGYNRRDNEDAPSDGDHVLEKQLGGPDEVNNVWPLNSRENQTSGSNIRVQIEKVVKAQGLSSLKDKWVILKF